MTNNKAFSLIELSIVLIIIGLLVAGITGGQSLIESAKIKNLANEIDGWRKALLIFRVKNDRWPGDLDNDGLYNLALKNSQIALKNGITTVRDCGSLSDITFKLRDDINNNKISGARIITSGEAVTTRGGHLNFMGVEADTQEEMIKAAERMIQKGADFIKLIVSGGNTTPGSKDNVDQYDYQHIKAITDYVHTQNKKIMVHVHTKIGMEKCIKAGVDFIEHGSWRTSDGIDIDFDLIKEMHDKKII